MIFKLKVLHKRISDNNRTINFIHFNTILIKLIIQLEFIKLTSNHLYFTMLYLHCYYYLKY